MTAGDKAVAETLARILAAKHPGTHWAPAKPGDKNVIRLCDETDLAAISDRSDRGRRAA